MTTKKAELGLSTLIIITSILIVSSIVFYALYTSVTTVTQEAKGVGLTVMSNVGTATAAIQLSAEDGTVGNAVDYFYLTLKPVYASDEYKLSQALLIMSMPNISQEYTYNYYIDCDVHNSSLTNSTYHASNGDQFGVKYLNGGSANYNDTVVGGEQIQLCWMSPDSLEKDERAVITFITRSGMVTRLDVDYRDLMWDKTIYLFP